MLSFPVMIDEDLQLGHIFGYDFSVRIRIKVLKKDLSCNSKI